MAKKHRKTDKQNDIERKKATHDTKGKNDINLDSMNYDDHTLADKNIVLPPKKIFDRKSLIVLVGLIILVTIFFHNSVENGFVFDDVYYIEQNTFVHDFTWEKIELIFTENFTAGANRNTGLYRPLANFIWAFTYEISPIRKLDKREQMQKSDPTSPAFFHITNLLVHILVSFLVYLLALSLFNDFRIGVISACLYAVAAVHTEAVDNISVLSELLATMFILASLLVHIKLRRKYSLKFYLLALLFFTLALLSKESGMVTIGLILLIDFFFPYSDDEQTKITKDDAFIQKLKKNFKTDFRRILRNFSYYIGYGAILLFYFFIRYNIFDGFTSEGVVAFVDNPMHDASVTYFEQLMTAIKVFGKYIVLMLMPAQISFENGFSMIGNLSSDYSYNAIPIVTSFFNSEFLFGLLLLSIVVVTFFAAYFTNRKFSFLIAFFMAPFFIVSNFVIVIGTILGERLLYLPSVGFYIALGAIFILPIRYLKKYFKDISIAVYFVVAAIGIINGYLAYERNTAWFTNMSLFEADKNVIHNSTKIFQNISSLKANEKLYDEAIEFSRKSLCIYPDNKKALLALGVSLSEKGKVDRGIEYVARIVDNLDLKTEYGKKMFFTKDIVNGYIQLSSLKARVGKVDSAINDLSLYFQQKNVPNYDPLYERFGSLLAMKFNYDQVLHFLKNLLKNQHPKAANAILSRILTKTARHFGQLNKMEDARKALDLLINKGKYDLSTNYTTLGKVYLKEKKYNEAQEAFNKGLKVNPQNKEILFYLSQMYMKNQPNRALEYINKALSVDPNFLQGHRIKEMILKRLNSQPNR